MGPHFWPPISIVHCTLQMVFRSHYPLFLYSVPFSMLLYACMPNMKQFAPKIAELWIGL